MVNKKTITFVRKISSASSTSAIYRFFSITEIEFFTAISQMVFLVTPGSTGVSTGGVNNWESFTRKILLIQPSARQLSTVNQMEKFEPGSLLIIGNVLNISI